QLSAYSFYHLVHGQAPPVVEVARPAAGGFAKGFHVLFVQGISAGNPDQSTEESVAFLKCFFGRMGEGVEPARQVNCPGRYAHLMMEAALAAAADFEQVLTQALGRIARLCDAQLDCSASYCNYRAEKAFKAELRRVQRWYRPGRRRRRWRAGVARERRQAVAVKCARSVITQKVRDHFRRMRRRVKVEGLMNWRDVALATRQAGIPVQSGTVPVERLWSYLEDVMPSAARGVSLRWFRVLSVVMFLRYNYAHFNKDNLPTMAERDPLLGQRLATIAMLARAVNESDQGLSHLAPLFDPFGSR
ncbi:unnamed protein product, partial [Prorocentrum cordatum]